MTVTDVFPTLAKAVAKNGAKTDNETYELNDLTLTVEDHNGKTALSSVAFSFLGTDFLASAPRGEVTMLSVDDDGNIETLEVTDEGLLEAVADFLQVRARVAADFAI